MDKDNPPEWALKKAVELINAGITPFISSCHTAAHNVARYIAEHEEAPVDPDLIEARNILAKDSSDASWAAHVRKGGMDGECEMSRTLKAIKRGRELERKVNTQ